MAVDERTIAHARRQQRLQREAALEIDRTVEREQQERFDAERQRRAERDRHDAEVRARVLKTQQELARARQGAEWAQDAFEAACGHFVAGQIDEAQVISAQVERDRAKQRLERLQFGLRALGGEAAALGRR